MPNKIKIAYGGRTLRWFAVSADPHCKDGQDPAFLQSFPTFARALEKSREHGNIVYIDDQEITPENELFFLIKYS